MMKNHFTKSLLVTLCCLFGLTALQAQATLNVEGVGDVYGLRAIFGPNFEETIRAEIALADDGTDPASDACTEITNDLNGKIALIDRGGCGFTVKAINAQNAGAVAVVICNNDADNPNQLNLLGGDDGGVLTIPSVSITFSACEAIKAVLANGVVMADLIPSLNNICREATAIGTGTFMVDTIFADPVLGGIGGMPSNPGDNDATAAVWYAYTPPADGILTVNSCEGGADTRLWVHTGSCDVFGLNLVTVAQNDDACIFDPNNLEDEYASFVSTPVQAGITYLIEWDNRWNDGPFTFNVAFEEMEVILAPGQVCDSAIVIDAGTYVVDTISEFGQTGLYNTNGSEWYSFTAPFSGLLSVSACGGGDTDTRLLIHQGDCGTLTQVAFSDDACAAFEGDADEIAAFVENLTVAAGETYLIEWSGRWDPSGFEFTVSLDTLPTVDVTFTVDMALQTVGEDGVNMVWAFAAPDTLADVNLVALSDEDGDNKWTTTLQLTTLDTIGFAFVNGGLDVANVEAVPDDCGVDSGFGFNIRPLIVTEIDSQAVEIFCFGFCRSCGPENCDNPFVEIEDDFESYQAGALGPQSDFWTTWSGTEGGAEDGIIGPNPVDSTQQAMRIEGSNGPQDVLLLLGDQTAGHYILSWEMYVPADKQAYYNIQKIQGEPGEEFGMQVAFEADGTASLDAGAAAAVVVPYSQDEWISVEHYIDLNNDNIRLYIDGAFAYSWPFSWGTFEQSGTKQLGAVDFFPTAGESLFFIDDVYFAEIPPASEGQYAHTAVAVESGQMYTTPQLDCFGAGFSVFSNGNGRKAYWYSYEATANGYLALSSCEGGADSRMWVFRQDDPSITMLGVNDDLCPVRPGSTDLWASYREVPVTAGETYLILFDDPWETTPVEWSLELIEGELPIGDFCQSAIPITPGTITIDTLNGNAAVANRRIASFRSSLTGYANAEWYSFTAPVDGSLEVYTCESLPQRSGLYIYDGSCGFDSLTLVALGENGATTDPIGCDPTTAVRNIAVQEGVTYYIEWASKADERPGFDFILEFGEPAVNVTFVVDMSILASEGELSGQGAWIAGDFNNFEARPMEEDTDGDNIYSLTVSLMKGDTVLYRFFNGPFEEEELDLTVGEDCSFDAFGDRFIVVGQESEVVETVCFGFCVDCAATSTENIAFQQALQVFPNPAKERTTVQYQFEQSTDLMIQLTNTLGQIIHTQEIDKAIAGYTDIALQGLPSGIYQLRIRSGENVKTETLVVE
ncbi:MAG: PA domain-containing protein [Bacteroidota bacterium]